MSSRVRIIIQARIESSRLPGKIMAKLAGEPMLTHVVRRLEATRNFGRLEVEVMVATTVNTADDPTESLCSDLGVRCFRGPVQDVLARYVAAAADLSNRDVVVRATADNPLYCPLRTAKIIASHLHRQADYTCIRNLSYVVPEVMQVGALRTMASLARNPHCREHVTPYFREEANEFRVEMLPERWQGLRPETLLTVDTRKEYERMTRLFCALGEHGSLFPLEEIYNYCDQEHIAGFTQRTLEPMRRDRKRSAA